MDFTLQQLADYLREDSSSIVKYAQTLHCNSPEEYLQKILQHFDKKAGLGMVLTIDGMISVGKSSLVKILSQQLNSKPYFEEVNNDLLDRYYKDVDLVKAGKIDHSPVAFELQIAFLGDRFRALKKAMKNNWDVLDRNIFTDMDIFAKKQYDDGIMTKDEFETYSMVAKEMLEEYPYFNRYKKPDLMIYLKTDLPTVLSHIDQRGRDYEQDDDLTDYYTDLLSRYQEWASNWNISPLLEIDCTNIDFVHNLKDRKYILTKIYNKMRELSLITDTKYQQLISKLNTMKLAPLKTTKEFENKD